MDPSTQAMAVRSLGKLKSPRAAGEIVRALRSPSIGLRYAAAEALGEMGDPRTFDYLMRALDDDDEHTREAVAKALKSVDEDTAAAILAAELTADDPRLRARAAEALGNMEYTKAVKPLLAALADPGPAVRKAVAKALSQSTDPDVVRALIGALHDRDPGVRAAAALALGQSRASSAAEPLVKALRDEDASARMEAAFALGRLKDPRAVEPLLAILAEKKPEPPEALGPPRTIREFEEMIASVFDSVDPRKRAGQALTEIGGPAVDGLIAALAHPDAEVRREAASALWTIDDARKVEPLIAALKDENAEVRNMAANGLGNSGDPKAVPALVESLTDWEIRDDVAYALRDLNWAPASDAEQVHLLIARGAEGGAELWEKREGTRAVLLEDLAAGDQRTRQYAVNAAIVLGDDSMIAGLIELLVAKGNESMATALLASGEPQLRKAAESWAHEHEMAFDLKKDPDLFWGAWRPVANPRRPARQNEKP